MKITANSKHPTRQKVEKLLDILQNQLKLEVSFYGERIFIKDMERPTDKDWDLCDEDGEFISELPCNRFLIIQEQATESLRMVPRDIPAAPPELEK